MLQQTSIQSRFSRGSAAKVALRNGRSSMGVAPDSLAEALGMMGAAMPFSRNMEIYGEGEPAAYLYKVVHGAVRTHRLLNDGRRQIGGFYLPGDVFGMEIDDVHRLSAEAICDSKILVLKRSTIVALAARQGEIAHDLWAMTARELAHLQNLMLTLGRKTAQERLAAFLLEMAARSRSSDAVDLPMSRQDIADYLGLTIETVSRTLTHLENELAIALPTSRRIVLRNRAALNRMNS
jgi:CRP/FNR family transcriptional regulator, nitrogen fixation regulation protein